MELVLSDMSQKLTTLSTPNCRNGHFLREMRNNATKKQVGSGNFMNGP